MKEPLEFEEKFDEKWKNLVKRFGQFSSFAIVLVAVIVILGFWLASGVYTVGPAQVGLVKQFGKYVTTTGPGFHYRFPSPIQSVVIVDKQSVRTEEIGFRSRAGVSSTQFASQDSEALMLTMDFNIIRAETVIQFDVIDAQQFAFEVEDYRSLMNEAAQAIIRERVATRNVDEALTEKREEIAGEVQTALQDLLDFYGTGIRIINVRLQEVTPPSSAVAQAFDDVNSAVQDKERTIFEAERYANERIPVALGEKQKILNDSEAYKQSRILQADGDVARFLAVLDRYRLGESVTEARLYIETMEEILPGLKKIIIPGQGNGLLSLLNLDQLVGSETP